MLGINESIELKEKVNGFSQRDLHSKAIFNTDMDAYLNYKIQRSRLLAANQDRNELYKMKEEVAQIKSDLSDIKDLLVKLTNIADDNK